MIKEGIFCGCFDIYHVGHQRAIMYCQSRCKNLTIGLFTDEAIYRYKGQYPSIPYEFRKALLKEIFPNCQILTLNEHGVHNFNAYDVYFVSEEFIGKNLLVDATFRGEVYYFPRQHEGISSSAVRRKLESKNQRFGYD
jgi:cytidyltransferase-like protein